MKCLKVLFLFATIAMVQPGESLANDAVHVAVAANFSVAARRLGEAFQSATGHRLIFSPGATGQLYSQIANGAPFHVFLAADRARPARAIAEGWAVAGSQFTYARGRLALFSADTRAAAGVAALRTPTLSRLAIANPATAPYGVAAMELLRSLDLTSQLVPKLVRGASVAQAFQFVATGHAELGLVALSQVLEHGTGSHWPVPQWRHAPISQDAVLCLAGRDHVGARAFVEFLASEQSAELIRALGYER